MDNRSLSHVRWKFQYHIVFIPKYRKKVLYGKLKADVRDIISTLCRYKDVEINVNDWFMFDTVFEAVEASVKAYYLAGKISEEDLKNIFKKYGIA